MKKFYTCAAVAMLALASSGDAFAREATQVKSVSKIAPYINPRAARAAAEEANKPVWCAATRKLYYYTDNDWLLDETYKTTYYPDGMEEVVDIITEGRIMRETLKYNEIGYMTYRLREVSDDGGETFTPSELLERTFDPVVNTLPVTAITKMFQNGAWVETGSSYTRTVTRNGEGNITSVVVAVPYQGKYDPIERLTVEYGEDGKANHIVSERLTNNGTALVWQTDAEYKDIVWDRTDGQIASVENLNYGANRIASVTINEGDSEKKMSVAYLDELGSNRAVITSDADGVEWEFIATTTYEDEFGSYVMLTQDKTTYEDETYVVSGNETYTVNEFGLEMRIIAAETSDGEVMVFENMQAEMTTDPVYGYPLTYIRKIADEEAGLDDVPDIYESKLEFSDYYDVAGLRAVAPAENNAAPVRYFDLSGRAVANPACGIYIRQQGSKSEKILVK